jgi:hypothetical protein
VKLVSDFLKLLPDFVKLLSDFVKLLSDFVKLLSDLVKLLADFMKLLSDFVKLLSDFVKLLSEFVKLLSDFVKLLSDFVKLLSDFVETASGVVSETELATQQHNSDYHSDAVEDPVFWAVTMSGWLTLSRRLVFKGKLEKFGGTFSGSMLVLLIQLLGTARSLTGVAVYGPVR